MAKPSMTIAKGDRVVERNGEQRAGVVVDFDALKRPMVRWAGSVEPESVMAKYVRVANFG